MAASPTTTPEARQIALTGSLLLIPIAKGQQPIAKGRERDSHSVRVD